MTPDYLTPAQVAEVLQITPHTARELLAAKKLPGRKVGSLWRTSRRELDAFMEGSTTSARTHRKPVRNA